MLLLLLRCLLRNRNAAAAAVREVLMRHVDVAAELAGDDQHAPAGARRLQRHHAVLPAFPVEAARHVAVRVAFCDSKGLKPVSHLMRAAPVGSRVETIHRFHAMSQLYSTCTASPLPRG